MPSNYKKKTNYKPISPETLQNALTEIKISKKSAFSIAKKYSIPKSNMYRYVAEFEDKVPADEVTAEKVKEFNSIKCDTCKRDFHLKCAQFTGSSFTCKGCDSEISEISEHSDID